MEQVVVVGAGFAGLRAVRTLRKEPVRVWLVDKHNYQTFQPLLYQVATAGLNVEDVAFPVRGVLRRCPNARFHLGDVASVAVGERHIAFDDGSVLPYDYLVLAGGARAGYFGIPGAEEHTWAPYTLDAANHLRSHILACFESADRRMPEIDTASLTFVVVGGGPTGVEMAGALSEVVDTIVRKDFRELDASTVRVILVEMLDTILPTFTQASQRYAVAALRQRGVDLRLEHTVAEVTNASLRFTSGECIDTRTVIWAAGVRAGGLAGELGAEQTNGGRVVVNGDLSLPGHPEVFVVGDLAAPRAPDGSLYPQVAQVAIQSGEHAARQIVHRIAGRATTPFVYKDKGAMATIGRRAAVTELPSGIRFSGSIGWLSWLFLHLLYLVGFRNRLSVLLNWAWSYVARERGPRLILDGPEPPRPG